MVEYKTSGDNRDYFVMNNPGDLIAFMENNHYNHNDIVRRARISFNKLREELASKEYVFKDLAVKKNSDLGEYISRDRNGYFFKNLDEKILYKDIINAYNISIVEENPYMDILKGMVSDEIHGDRDVLEKRYSKDIVNYINENKDFYKSYEVKKGTYNTKDSIIYDGEFKVGNLYEMSKSRKTIVK